MAYSREVYAKAAEILEQRRGQAAAKAAEYRTRMIQTAPRIREIEQQMALSSAKAVRATLEGMRTGQDPAGAIEKIKTENLALQVELSMLLQENGGEYHSFEPQYVCRKCEDTGVAFGKRCECMEALLRELSCQELTELSGMKTTSFDDLSLEYYQKEPDSRTGISPRERMRQVIAYCRSYAEDFDGTDISLLLRGPTGTGKTHLSLAIAGVVLSKGYSVVYGPAQQLLHRLEREHFGRADGNSEDVLLACDLLILDDVGTEFSGPFYVSALYNIINGRMLLGKPTIISTNLNQKELTDRYGEQIASRVTGTFQPLVCSGRDIRLQKLKQSLT